MVDSDNNFEKARWQELADRLGDGDSDRPLELSRERKRELIRESTQRVLDHLEQLPEEPVVKLNGAREHAETLREPLPEGPTPFGELLTTLFEDAIAHSAANPHPKFMAYVPGGGLYHAAVADFIANATNRYVGTWFEAPALVAIESTVIRWFCEIMGYPEDSFGLLTSGGSMANLIATITARQERLGDDFLDGIVYTSDQSHHSVTKAATLAGFREENVRSVPTDDRYRIDVDALAAQVRSDREAGAEPFLVVGTAGSTNTGAVDDLDALADYCARADLWLHADAAYGGFFALTETGRERLSGLDRCDSITIDPHKGLFLPYGTGALLVRDGTALARTHATSADYLPDWEPTSGTVDFSRLGPEQSRDFRGLRVWLPLKMHGVDAFRETLAEKLSLAESAAKYLRDLDDVTLVDEPQLSTVAFRVEPPGVDDAALDDLNRTVLETVNARQRVHLSGTILDGVFALRICILGFRTHREHVAECLAEIERAVSDVSA
ncbi:aminotransferase class V-fold PLP-dependent enzyme [Halomicrobium sp. IBSBa]|uniref:pyridoxal phosphate-dependent decarboxylase family protein n=1 Tax=Halomicrobium sp. IBSBa TaxID=2778916 RepID=UPI001AC008F2|nr:aminotransferase class V-fold PLP-dependent enzyme [Halomicrobium sp. IBSBa]MBO4247453.1 aminotransferase class V-fold PLP-dependent enzyme [Halomicrobium sp. IBSBa]